VKDLALNSLVDILKEQEKEAREIFIQMALENIKKGDTFYSSIIFLKKILHLYPLESQNKIRVNINT